MEITATALVGFYIIVSLTITVSLSLYLAFDGYACHLRTTGEAGNFIQGSKLGTSGYNYDNVGCYIMIFMTLPFVNIFGYPATYLLLKAKS